MKSVLISIHPKWCELIASGKKTIEVRKSIPKVNEPFKVYIYCTHNGSTRKEKDRNIYTDFSGKVIGEFICEQMTVALYGEYCILPKSKTMLDELDLLDYAGGKILYGWHISNLVIYDKPRELGEFKKECKLECDMRSLKEPPCEKCEHLVASFGCGRTITRPPQSWCYVESEVNT